MHVRCPQCSNPIDLGGDDSLSDIECPSCGSHFHLISSDSTTKDATCPFDIGKFKLLEQVGLGRFGSVWKARDVELDRIVAIKIPRRGDLDPAAAEDFAREAKAAARLKHPHIVSVHATGKENGTFYIVTDFIDGPNLSEWLSGQRLTSREAAQLCATLAHAVHHAHEEGIIHRDLKPGNILMDKSGQPYVADFGLAKHEFGEVTVTLDGKILGTPAYMPPEQARGEGHSADRRSDIYSLGVILYELLTGQRPFRGERRMLLHQILSDEPVLPRKLCGNIPLDLQTICLKCMEKEPAQRYQSAAELADDLQRYLAGMPIQARPLSSLARTVRWARRNPAVAGLLAVIMVVLLAASVISANLAIRAQRHADALAAALYDGLLREIQLKREARREGYLEDVHDLVRTALELETPRQNPDELRREMIQAMGDFVGYSPRVMEDIHATAIALMPNGQELAIATAEGFLVTYRTSSLQEQQRLELDAGTVGSLEYSADNKRLVAAGDSGRVQTWEHDGKGWQVGNAFDVSAADSSVWMELSSGGVLLAVVDGSTAQVWDVTTGQPIQTMEPLPVNWTIRSVALEGSGKLLAATYSDEVANEIGWAAWELSSGKMQSRQSVELGSTYPQGIAFSHDGKRLVIGFDEAVFVYETEQFQRESFHRRDATKAVAFSPDGRFLAMVDLRGQIAVWNEGNGRVAATLTHWGSGPGGEALTFSADGRYFAAANANAVRIWNLAAADERVNFVGHRSAIPAVTFSPDGQQLVSGGKDGTVRFWDTERGGLLSTLSVGGPVQCLAFSKDGRLLAIGSWGGDLDKRLNIVDARTAEIVTAVSPDVGNVYGVAFFERDERRFLAASGREGLTVWLVDSNALGEPTHTPGNRSLDLAVSRQGKFVAWVHDDNQIRVSDLDRGELYPISAPRMQQGWHGLEFFPDDDRLAFITADGVAEIWSLSKDASAFSLGAEGEFKTPHIALSPQGELLAGLAEPDIVSIWSTADRQRIYTFRPEGSSIWSLAWGPQGQQLALGRNDGGLALWRLDRIARKLSQLGLTTSEKN